MEEIAFGKSWLDQRQILLWGQYVAICGDKPGMPVNWLDKRTIKFELTEAEKVKIIEFVWRAIGTPMRHKQCEKEWHLARERIESGPDSIDRGQSV